MSDQDLHQNLVDNDHQKVSIFQKMINPNYALHRYIVLVFMCFMGFGNYFVYDLPGALQNQVLNDMKVTTVQFSYLYSWYSWPNVVLCFFGGFLTDRVFGIRLGAIIFSSIILLGQFVIALGAYMKIFWLMNLGRFIYGIGGESLAVTQNSYAVSWFRGKELNMVFGFQLSFSRIGSSISFYLMNPIYQFIKSYFPGDTVLALTILVASSTCVFSLFNAFILAYLDKRCEKITNRVQIQSTEQIKLKDVKSFPINFWILSIICVSYYITIFPFVSLATLFLKRKYSMSENEANACDACIYIISAVISPLFGFLIDKTGKNLIWISVGTILTNIAHFLIAYTFITPWFCTILMGFGYSILASSLWPMVSLIIPDHQLSTAYGMMQAIQNTGLGFAIMFAGYIVDNLGYIYLENQFLISLLFTLFLIAIQFYYDLKRNNGSLS